MLRRCCLAASFLLIACGPQPAHEDPGTSGTGDDPTAHQFTTGEPIPTTGDPPGSTTAAPDPTTGAPADRCDEIVLDPTLRATVLSSLVLPEDAVLTASDALTVTTLDHTNNFGGPVQSLAGLECFENLTKLRVDFSDVTDLTPVAGLPLTVLSLASSDITDLSPLAASPTLTALLILDAPLADLGPVASMPALQILNVDSTEVVDFTPLAAHPTLRGLAAGRTHPQDLTPLVTIPQLETLDLTDCGLGSVTALAGAPALIELTLSTNAITTLAGLETIMTLQSLDLSANKLTGIAQLTVLDQMIELNLADNQIADLGPLVGAVSLQALTLTNNPLAGLDGLESLPLSFLVADNTGLTELVPVAPQILDFLSLADNQISDLTPLADHLVLRSLNIKNNAITTLAPIAKSAWIATGCPALSLAGNNLDADTLTQLIPALCATDRVEVHWEQGECQPAMQCIP